MPKNIKKVSDPTLVIIWRGIELPGHEACRLSSGPDGWHLEGEAVFVHDQKPCQLNYRILCDREWQTQSAEIDGWVGLDLVHFQLRSGAGHKWQLNGVEVPAVAGCIDVDLNFSPSTNTIAIRRLKQAVGEKSEITAAWLRFPSFTLEPLPQSYQRLSDEVYRYESGNGRYTADLHVSPAGFVLDYPQAWVAECCGTYG